jgi:hypothetical protein
VGWGLDRVVQALVMACRFALLLDRGPHGSNRALPVHLTCPACGGHHAVPVTDRLPIDRPWRAAERLAATASEACSAPGAGDLTHQCRDCGHQWSEVAPATPPSA